MCLPQQRVGGTERILYSLLFIFRDESEQKKNKELCDRWCVLCRALISPSLICSAIFYLRISGRVGAGAGGGAGGGAGNERRPFFQNVSQTPRSMSQISSSSHLQVTDLILKLETPSRSVSLKETLTVYQSIIPLKTSFRSYS